MIIPEPEYVRAPPVPTVIVAVVLVPLVIALNAEPPPPDPQSDPVPDTTPDVLTCKHWVDPVMLENVGAVENVFAPVTVCVVLSVSTVPDVAGNVNVVASVPLKVSELVNASVLPLVPVSVYGDATICCDELDVSTEALAGTWVTCACTCDATRHANNMYFTDFIWTPNQLMRPERITRTPMAELSRLRQTHSRTDFQRLSCPIDAAV